MTIMDYIHMSLVPALCVLAVYCAMLSRRIRKLNDLESGLGSAIAVMSAEVDKLDKSLRAAQETTQTQSDQLTVQLRRAQTMSNRLDKMVDDAQRPQKLRRRRQTGARIDA